MPDAEKTFLKIWAALGSKKSFETNLFIGTEILKSYAKEVLEIAAKQNPESAQAIRSIELA